MQLKKIASFQIDHTLLDRGMYISRQDGDITTYDIRMTKPNGGIYLENAALHSFEHLFASFARSTHYAEKVIYVGPMGCRTGFYLLVRDMTHQDAIALVNAMLNFIATFDGDIPGATEKECGNYREQDLTGAKALAQEMIPVLNDWTPQKLEYPC